MLVKGTPVQELSPLPSTPLLSWQGTIFLPFLCHSMLGTGKRHLCSVSSLVNTHNPPSPGSWDLPSAQKKASISLWILVSLDHLFYPWSHRSAIGAIPGLLQGLGVGEPSLA